MKVAKFFLFVMEKAQPRMYVTFMVGVKEFWKLRFGERERKAKKFPPSVNCFILKSCCNMYVRKEILEIAICNLIFYISNPTCLFFPKK